MGYPSKIGQYRDGLFRRDVTRLSSASTGYNLSEDESGKIFYVPTPTTMMIRLPKASSKWLGVNYGFFLEEGCSAVDIVTNLDSSARIVGVGTSGSTESAVQGVRPRTTQFAVACELTAISSVFWLFEDKGDPGLVIISSAASSVATLNWAAGTTST